MVTLFKPPKNKAKKQQPQQRLTIESLNHEGVGVARINNKVCFVEGALTGETVLASVVQKKSTFERFSTDKILTASPSRIAPFCQHYDLCGGCQLQHLAIEEQLIEKQKAVSQLFKKFANMVTLNWQPAIESDSLHYRRSARIAVYYSPQHQSFQLGFRQKSAKRIINIEKCLVLDTSYIAIFSVFRQLLPKLKNGRAITHIQLCSVNYAFVILRHIKPLSSTDLDKIQKACTENNWKLVLEGETGKFKFLGDHNDNLPNYQLTKQQLSFAFKFNNFIQVNDSVNQKMITQALDWLALSAHESVLDLFCGIGNFSLAMASQAKKVIGVEGVEASVAMAKINAKANNSNNTEFYCQDLSQALAEAAWFKQTYDVLVLDPSRIGAFSVLTQLTLKKVNRILYISCDPVTLARDTTLIADAGFSLDKIALMNMFPHTKHIETMALFVKA
ncbi:23S rRNA (uracil(1939)-C(5))-methyltransferase RlmD [Thalassotalea piscium]|uniref:23S rRNA (uracil(1939)-C(5))-methyltransferase RlmD n=1 Tax=Thalassotalea piscium TaxID=1230533 RepID=A0A7X0TU46_9GAMM|nr:23S rRNA (uracil(1939)-C(5))-methyltransferase RlmD [Thalassotalea piscium]MBB6543946.1 23S rRNA (uracil1939-C5)-methyltransferase [Thalassotalea piscium]